jgi:hypothetical protein
MPVIQGRGKIVRVIGKEVRTRADKTVHPFTVASAGV